MRIRKTRWFVASAALLLGNIAVASFPAESLAGDDTPTCPGSRCTGRSLPLCCTTSNIQGDHGLATEFYYFPNAS